MSPAAQPHHLHPGAVSADAEPDLLYRADSGTEAFEFARTASRLTEMRSQEYSNLAHRGFIAET